MSVARMTLEEWQAEGYRRFGSDQLDWEFVCPSCKTAQTVRDMLGAGGKDTQIAFSCIGRFTKGRGCDWTLGGLLTIHELEIDMGEGEAMRPAFVFADAPITQVGVR